MKKRDRTPPRRISRLALWLTIIVMALSAAAGFLALRSSSAPPYQPLVTGAPSLAVDQELVDLGDVPLGEWVEVTFTLQNVGDRELRFIQPPYIEVVAGC